MNKKSNIHWNSNIIVSNFNPDSDILSDFRQFYEPISDHDVEHNLKLVQDNNDLVFYFM